MGAGLDEIVLEADRNVRDVSDDAGIDVDCIAEPALDLDFRRTWKLALFSVQLSQLALRSLTSPKREPWLREVLKMGSAFPKTRHGVLGRVRCHGC